MMHYSSSNTWRPGRQTMININPWDPVPYEDSHTNGIDKNPDAGYSKQLTGKIAADDQRHRQQ